MLRTETERPEAVEAGCARLIGTDRQAIVDQVTTLWQDDDAYRAMQSTGNPFGDGHACQRIVAHIERALSVQTADAAI
ncbi:MAG: UDP-N-acetylglucosamine 2-epimerase [Burkholderiaceae bacterium]|nr:UDP-N-acetylglucosamine 2-epimerase [Burkholderiaceae bacterium]